VQGGGQVTSSSLLDVFSSVLLFIAEFVFKGKRMGGECVGEEQQEGKGRAFYLANHSAPFPRLFAGRLVRRTK
jgi:hypothetical protein